MVLKEKSNGDYKARLVARGFQQENKFKMCDLYVAKLTTFRILLVMANIMKQPIHQMDVKGALLYSDINEEVYMPLPGTNRNISKFVCNLNKSIYSSNEYLRNWNKKFDVLINVHAE